MKTRIVSRLLPLLLLTALSAAASASVSAQEPPPPPPPARDYFPDKWAEYKSEAGEFRVRFPAEPRESASPLGDFEVRSLEYKGLLHYRVSYVDYKTPLDDPQKFDGLLQGVKNSVIDSVRGKGVRVVAEREVTVDGHKGIFVHFEVGGKEVIRALWVVAGSRLFSLFTSGRKGTPNELEGKDDFEKVASGFINSFHLAP